MMFEKIARIAPNGSFKLHLYRMLMFDYIILLCSIHNVALMCHCMTYVAKKHCCMTNLEIQSNKGNELMLVVT